MIDPRDHVGLAYTGAAVLADRWGGERDEWVGFAYEVVVKAAKLYDPARGAFSTYAIASIRLSGTREAHRRRGDQWRAPEEKGPRRQVWTRLPVQGGVSGEAEAIPARAEQPEPSEVLRGLIVVLSPRHRRAVEMRAKGAKLDAIGTALGVTKERARQIIAEAIEEMRKHGREGE